MRNFRQLMVWERAHKMVILIYQSTKSFPVDERFNLTSQLRRAATSVPTNISEGCGKFSQLESATYLQTAHASTQEVEYLAFLSCELEYLNQQEYLVIDKQINELKAMLNSLIVKVRSSGKKRTNYLSAFSF